MSSSLDYSDVYDHTPLASSYASTSFRDAGKVYSNAYDEARKRAAAVWDESTKKYGQASSVASEEKLLEDWEVTDCQSGFDNANSLAVKEKTDTVAGRLLGVGATIALGAQKIGAGAFALKHGLGLYAYATAVNAPSTFLGSQALFSVLPAVAKQYVAANVASAGAGALTGFAVTIPFIGAVSAASLATTAVALTTGVIAVKGAEAIYNSRASFEDEKIHSPVFQTMKKIGQKLGTA